MRAEPPAGDELTELLTTVKARVLRDASKTRQKRLRRGLVALFVTGATILAIGGAGAAFATDFTSGIFRPIPHTTRHPADPPQPVSTNGINNPITADQASLDQLWAGVDMNMQAGGEWKDRGAGQVDPTFLDFETAIEKRCEPGLSATERTDLDTKWVHVQQQATDATAPLHDVEKAYFDAATDYCM